MTIERLEHACIQLVDAGFGWAIPSVSAAEMMATISQYRHIDGQRNNLLAAQQDHERLVRELDVLLNGEAGAAQQASLCDIVAQVAKDGVVAKTQLHKLATTMENVIMAGTSGSRGMRNFLAEAKKALDEVKEVL